MKGKKILVCKENFHYHKSSTNRTLSSQGSLGGNIVAKSSKLRRKEDPDKKRRKEIEKKRQKKVVAL